MSWSSWCCFGSSSNSSADKQALLSRSAPSSDALPPPRRGTVSSGEVKYNGMRVSIEQADPNDGAAILHEAKKRDADLQNRNIINKVTEDPAENKKRRDEALQVFWTGKKGNGSVQLPNFGQGTYHKALDLYKSKQDAKAKEALLLLQEWAVRLQDPRAQEAVVLLANSAAATTPKR